MLLKSVVLNIFSDGSAVLNRRTHHKFIEKRVMFEKDHKNIEILLKMEQDNLELDKKQSRYVSKFFVFE